VADAYGILTGVIFGAHVIVYTNDAEADRAFLRDALGFEGVDAGDGWLIFALPPAEIALHPSDPGGRHELYLMCDGLDATVRELHGKGVEVAREVSDQAWGRLTWIRLPGGGEIGLYEPRHATPLAREGRSSDVSPSRVERH
jgi:catechol 2,3-dioxygenase-like lactoylglutathione lyase family enzyme